MYELESTKENLSELSYVAGSAYPFIDEGDGFTSDRERVRMLLSLVAHAGGYKIMVGACHTVDITVECQIYVGGGVVFFGCGRRRRLPHCWILEACEGFYHDGLVR